MPGQRAMLVKAAGVDRLPVEVEERAADRLRWLVLGVAILFSAAIPLRFLSWAKNGVLLTLSDIVGAGFAGLSMLTFVALRYGRWPAPTVLNAGLVYEVLLCFALAIVEQVLVGFAPMPFHLSLVAIVLLTFPLVVATPLVRRLLAIWFAALSHPFAMIIVDAIGGSGLHPLEVATASAPTFLVAGLAAWLSQLVHRLRLDVGRALNYGQYELVKKLGEGGMGEVWEARHARLLRPAAVKLIRAETAGVYGDSARARFRREAQATGALVSPHTVELFDFGTTDDGTLYYAMELLEGIDLESFVHRFGPMDPMRVLHVMEQAALSLAEAHELGLVHRDVKPANIFISRAGVEVDFVKVLDFGLVKPRFVAEDSPVSVAGAVSGTPGYVAPETAAGREIDGRADLYSLGCVAYFLLTGQRVFVRQTRMAVLTAHLSEDPDAPSERIQAPIPPAIDSLVLELLARDPNARPKSARALVERIAELRRTGGAAPWDQTSAQLWWSTHLTDLSRPRAQLVL